jgi:hypothetical protein
MFYVAISTMGSYFYLQATSLEEAKERVAKEFREHGYEFNGVYLLEHFSVVEEFNENYLNNESGVS